MAIEIDQGMCVSDPRARERGREGVLQVITEVGLGRKGDPELMEQESEGVMWLSPCRARACSVGIS